MSRERLQLSLRFDDRRELLEAVKKQAKLSGMSLKDFVCTALENALSSGFTTRQDKQDDDKTNTFLETKIAGVEEQVNKHNELIGDLQTKFSDLKTDLSMVAGEPAPTPPNIEAIAQEVLKKLTAYNPVTITDLENLKQRIHAYDINRQADRRKHTEAISGLQDAAAILHAQVRELKSGLAAIAEAHALQQAEQSAPPTPPKTEVAPKKSPKKRKGQPPKSPKSAPDNVSPPVVKNWSSDAERFLDSMERNWQHNEWVTEDDEPY